jgi:acyl-CoA thioester hydrolase
MRQWGAQGLSFRKIGGTMLSVPDHAFTLQLTVQPEHLDDLNHVNNTVYLSWVQQVATAHWLQVAPAGRAHQYAWVVRRHEIDYIRQAFAQTPIEACTWVLPPEGLSFPRLMVFRHAQTKKPIAEVRTLWYLLDDSRQRGRPIPPEVLAWFGGPHTASGPHP